MKSLTVLLMRLASNSGLSAFGLFSHLSIGYSKRKICSLSVLLCLLQLKDKNTC